MRIERVNQQLKREISLILHQDLSDPRLQYVTVTSVNTSKDLRSARVYYSVFGPEEKTKDVKDVLRGAAGMIRCLIAEKLALRYTPELNFFYDNSLEIDAQIEETIKGIHESNQSDSNN